jgi:hypothetical protein
LRDEAEIQRQLEEKQKEIAAYRAFREEVEQQRELDRQLRNQLKIEQLQLYESMQVGDPIFILLLLPRYNSLHSTHATTRNEWINRGLRLS